MEKTTNLRELRDFPEIHVLDNAISKKKNDIAELKRGVDECNTRLEKAESNGETRLAQLLSRTKIEHPRIIRQQLNERAKDLESATEELRLLETEHSRRISNLSKAVCDEHNASRRERCKEIAGLLEKVWSLEWEMAEECVALEREGIATGFLVQPTFHLINTLDKEELVALVRSGNAGTPGVGTAA